MRLDEIKTDMLTAYKIMSYDPKSQILFSLAGPSIKIPAKISQTMKMSGDGIFMSNNKEFVLTNYSNLTDGPEVLLTLTYDPNSIILGNNTDNEAVFTVPFATIINIQKVSDE